MDLTAHDKQHHAIVASIVAEPGPSFSAGPCSAHARECVKSIREESFAANEAVLAAATREEAVADAATVTPEMAAAARAGEEAYCVADRDRTQQEQKLNLRSRAAEEQQARDTEGRALAKYLEEEEAARVRCAADDDTIRARRRDEDEQRRIVEEARVEEGRVAEASRRIAAEASRCIAVILQEEARVRRIAEAEEAEAARVRDQRVAEIAATERIRVARMADEEMRIATVKLRLAEQAAQDRQQQDRQQPSEMQEAEPEEEEAAHRTGVLTNNAMATHLWPRPRRRSIPISSPHGPQLVSNFVPAPAWYTRCSQLVPS